MAYPTSALTRRQAFVVTNTQSCTSALYVVNPAEAAVCPIQSHLDTPSTEPERHCFQFCLTRVRIRTHELRG